MKKQKNNDKGEQLIQRYEVAGTPFMIIETPDNGCFIHLGNFRVSKTLRTVGECRKLLRTKPWEILINVSLAVTTSELFKHNLEKHGEAIPNPNMETSLSQPKQVPSN